MDGEQVAALRDAVSADDGRAARRLLEPLREAEDDVLDVLAGRAAAGSDLAVELLVEQLDRHGVVRMAVRRFLYDEQAVDDVAQDTLVGVARGVRRFRGEARCRTFVYDVARNRVTDHLRRTRSTEPLDDHDVGDAARMSSIISSREAVQQLVARLPPPYREVVTLRDVDGLDYDQLADRLGRPPATIRSQVARGRALVAAMLREDQP